MAEQLGLQQVEVEDDSGRTLTGVGVAEESLQEVIDAREAGDHDAAIADGSEPSPGPSAPADSPAEPRRTDARDPQTGQFTKPTRGQKRFDQLTREAREAQRERDAEKERYAALEREFNELKTRQAASASEGPRSSAAPPTQAVKAADQVAATQARAGIQPTRPQPAEDDIGTKYQTYAEFVADTGRWVMEQGANDPQSPIRAAIRNELQGWQQEQTVTARKRELATNWDGATARGREKYQDFDQRVNPLLAVTLEGSILDRLAAHPQAEEIAYRIMSDAEFAAAFVGPMANATDQADVLGYLRRSMTPAAAAPASAARVASSTAPPPYQPVRASAKTTVPSPEEIAGAGGGDLSSSYDAYRAAKRRSS